MCACVCVCVVFALHLTRLSFFYCRCLAVFVLVRLPFQPTVRRESTLLHFELLKHSCVLVFCFMCFIYSNCPLFSNLFLLPCVSLSLSLSLFFFFSFFFSSLICCFFCFCFCICFEFALQIQPHGLPLVCHLVSKLPRRLHLPGWRRHGLVQLPHRPARHLGVRAQQMGHV